MDADSGRRDPAPALRGARPAPPPLRRRLRSAALLLLLTLAALAGGVLAVKIGGRRGPGSAAPEPIRVPSDPRAMEGVLASLDREVKTLRADNKRLSDKIARFQPRGTYIVIDTGENFLYVMKDGAVLLKALCATGSGVRLADPNTPRSWVFDTPRGELTVRGKTTDPIWVKPDWAFIETGEGIPRTLDDRMEEGVLGDYALDLGQGYLIHGTLFERALGLHVTHGCVRMGAKDLEYLFKNIPSGTKVYIV